MLIWPMEKWQLHIWKLLVWIHATVCDDKGSFCHVSWKYFPSKTSYMFHMKKKNSSANYLINRDRVWELSRINCFHRGCGSRGALVTRLAQLKTHVSNKTRTKWKSGFFPINQSKKKKKELSKKSQILTYLLSFFSGGDFLSQPWKRISPPLMSAARFCCLLRWNRSSVTGTWRLPEAGSFKELSAFGPHCRSLLPPLDQNQSSAERWCCRTHTPATSVRNDSSQKLPNWGEKGRKKYKTRPAHWD